MSKYHSGISCERISDVLKNKDAHIHFTGFAGAGMYPLYKLTQSLGYSVSGSERANSRFFEMEKSEGARVYLGHTEENISDCDLLVYSLAVDADNPELLCGEERGIPQVSRAEYLGALMLEYKMRIGVSGTHGKSTTTAMLDAIFNKNFSNHTTLIGASLEDTSLPYRIGNKETLIYESCEYKDSFLRFHPTVALFLNLEMDHTDYFEDLDALKTSFLNAMNRAPLSIVNADDENLADIVGKAEGRVVTFGMSDNSDYRASVLNSKRGKCKLRFTYHKKHLIDLRLQVPGVHNVINACGAFAAACECGIATEIAGEALRSFCGISRRVEYIGKYCGASVYYDYAHHPTEIRCTLNTVRELVSGKITVIFRPHMYSRTEFFMQEFADALSLADSVLLLEIDAIREEKISGVSSEILAALIGDFAESVSEENVISHLDCQSTDAVIIMGAANLEIIKERILKNGEE